jgi:hypothetical protein
MDEDAAPWPTEADEAAVVSEAAARGESMGRVALVAGVLPAETLPEPAGGANADSQPPLDTLVGLIPADVREALDELFRVKFIAVRNYPRESSG